MDDQVAAAIDEHCEHVLTSAGETSVELRAAAAANAEVSPDLRALVDKIHRTPWDVTDEEVAALRATYSDDALFEVILAAAIGAARDRLAAGMRALDEAGS